MQLVQDVLPGMQALVLRPGPAAGRQVPAPPLPGSAPHPGQRHGAATCMPRWHEQAPAGHTARTPSAGSRPLEVPRDPRRSRCNQRRAASGQSRRAARTRSPAPLPSERAAGRARTAIPRRATAGGLPPAGGEHPAMSLGCGWREAGAGWDGLTSRLRPACAGEGRRGHPGARPGRLEAETRFRLPPAFRASCEAGLAAVAGGPGAAVRPGTEPGILRRAGLRKGAAAKGYAAVFEGDDEPGCPASSSGLPGAGAGGAARRETGHPLMFGAMAERIAVP